MRSCAELTDFDYIRLGISFMEGFREIAEMTSAELVEHMDKYDLWGFMDDELSLRGLVGCDNRDLVYFFGHNLGVDECERILRVYDEKMGII